MKANIKDLQAKPKIIMTEMGEIPIYHMNLGVQAEMTSVLKTEPEKAGLIMAKYTLKKAFPEATEEELDNIDDKILSIILEAALEVNNLKVKKVPEENPLQ